MSFNKGSDRASTTSTTSNTSNTSSKSDTSKTGAPAADYVVQYPKYVNVTSPNA
jgi:hypothetical protein